MLYRGAARNVLHIVLLLRGQAWQKARRDNQISSPWPKRFSSTRVGFWDTWCLRIKKVTLLTLKSSIIQGWRRIMLWYSQCSLFHCLFIEYLIILLEIPSLPRFCSYNWWALSQVFRFLQLVQRDCINFLIFTLSLHVTISLFIIP